MSEFIDEKDRKILDVLLIKGDATTRQIAKETLLPATTIHHRIKRMKKEGVIKHFTVKLDPEKIGRGFAVHLLIQADINLLKKIKKTQYDILKKLKKLEYITRADIVTGGTDIIAIAEVKDVKEFDNILLRKIQLIEGISGTQSLIVIHRG